jgi:hypothetical protein
MLRSCSVIDFNVSSYTAFPRRSPVKKGSRLFRTPGLAHSLQKRIEYNENQKGINGFRVQIFFDSGNNARSKATAIRAEFIARNPDVGAYLSFQEPYFKVRVGDFRTRIEAEKLEKRN